MANKRALSRVDRLIGKLGRMPYGVFSVRDTRGAGIARSAISDRLRAGTLFRLHQGVYTVVPPALLKAEGRWLAAVFACGPGAVLSHTHAAALWNLRHRPSGPIHVTVPSRAGRRRRPGITIHRSSTLHASQTTLRRSIPVTTADRTLSDLRRFLSPEDYERARSRALDQHLDIGAPGDGAIPSRSELEHRLKSLCRRHGLPAPQGQQQLGPYTVDFLWPEARLVVEVDDFRTHGRRATFESDRVRDAWLQVRGYRVVRFTWRRLRDDPAGVVATLRALLG
jgi:very-short-patch-repair endonuclease